MYEQQGLLIEEQNITEQNLYDTACDILCQCACIWGWLHISQQKPVYVLLLHLQILTSSLIRGLII